MDEETMKINEAIAVMKGYCMEHIICDACPMYGINCDGESTDMCPPYAWVLIE